MWRLRLRQQMEHHRADALCASCHSKMDPLGFALENYDATGKWRTQDGKFPVDASGKFPNGKAFSGPAEMKSLLKDSMPEFTRCVAEKMLTYALGRGVETFDRLTVQDLVRQTTAKRLQDASLDSGNCAQRAVPAAQRHAETNHSQADAGDCSQMIVTRKALDRRTLLKGFGCRHGPALPRRHDACLRGVDAQRVARTPGLVLSAQRHRHAQLDPAG